MKLTKNDIVAWKGTIGPLLKVRRTFSQNGKRYAELEPIESEDADTVILLTAKLELVCH